jgi:hypothetical protein
MNQLTRLYHKYRDQLTEQFGIGFFHDPLSLFLLTTAGLGLLAILLLLIFRINPAYTSVPTSYNVVYGVTSTGNILSLYGYLLAATAFILLNEFLAWVLFDRERILSYLLGIVGFVIEIIFFIYLFNLTTLIR